jgi:hypothetical protein
MIGATVMLAALLFAVPARHSLLVSGGTRPER